MKELASFWALASAEAGIFAWQQPAGPSWL